MQIILRIIKRKRNLRRLSVLWIFLIAIELLCPVLGEDHVFAATASFTQIESNVSVVNNTETDINRSEDSLSSSDNQNESYHSTTFCNDECLCHATAIPSLVVPTVKQPRFSGERMAFLFVNPVYGSLPPPFHPPKLS